MERYIPIILILLLELLVLYGTDGMTDNVDILHSLQARYSARISFTLLSLTGTGIAGIGLHSIFLNERKRNILLGSIAAFAINHLIHYYFLYRNFEVNGLDIKSKYISFGALAYILLSIAPFIIWKWRNLTQWKYYGINGFIILMVSICIFTYSSRFGAILPLATPMWVFTLFIVIGILVILLIIGRVIKERNYHFDEVA